MLLVTPLTLGRNDSVIIAIRTGASKEGAPTVNLRIRLSVLKHLVKIETSADFAFSRQALHEEQKRQQPDEQPVRRPLSGSQYRIFSPLRIHP